MFYAFVRKLSHGARLTESEEELLKGLTGPVRKIAARRDIVADGDEPRFLILIIEGWACRYRLLENGKRQIIAFYLPGDLCEPFGILPQFMDNSIGASTAVVVANVSIPGLAKAIEENPGIRKALWWDLLVASSIEREHIVSLGRRSASERMAHLFCELHLRLEMVGLVDGASGYDLPLTQTDLADLLGLSAVHVNRSLQDLRRAGLISLRERRLTIHDLQGLRELGFFDPSYLHFDPSTLAGGGESRGLAGNGGTTYV